MTEAITTGIPRIGDPAPDFRAVTTHGEITFSDWQKGSWVILFSHPADFTPVCSTELSEFARRNDEFTRKNVKTPASATKSMRSWNVIARQRPNVHVSDPMRGVCSPH